MRIYSPLRTWQHGVLVFCEHFNTHLGCSQPEAHLIVCSLWELLYARLMNAKNATTAQTVYDEPFLNHV